MKKVERLEPQIDDDSSFKLIGLGGVGGIVARYLALFLAATGRPLRLVLIDGDAFEPSNLTRMLFTTHGNKAEVMRDELRRFFADSELTIAAVTEHISPGNVDRLIHEGDTVILAVDNHATRKLVNDHCTGLDHVRLISGGNDGVGTDSGGQATRGTYGNCQIYVRAGGTEITPSLTRFHDEIANPVDQLPTEAPCTQELVRVPQILFANLTAATAILNTLFIDCCGELHYGELCFDILDGLMRPLPQGQPAVLGSSAAS